jgi:predicted translin family RNA/ssDNA-binding protein
MNVVLKGIRRKYEDHEKARRQVAQAGDEAVRRAKQAIFALHRGDALQADALLSQTGGLLASCDRAIRSFPDLRGEGPYAAGLEEYAEALLFAGYVRSGRLGAIDARAMGSTTYLAGLCDATGEIVRYAMREATQGNDAKVADAFTVVEEVITYLLHMDLTGYLRTKFDQAKRNLRSLEQMRYEITLRKA